MSGFSFDRNLIPEPDLRGLKNIMDDYNATKPEEAPNWEDMWEVERAYEQQFPQNKSINPFTKEEDFYPDDWTDLKPPKSEN